MAPTDVIAVPSEPSWDESIWDELLAYIEAERVIPIIGPASFTVANEGRQISLERYVAEKLVPRLGLPAEALPSSPTLNEVVSLHLNRKGRREAVYPRIRDIVREAAFAPPKILNQLAEIRHFNLFVTTAFDPLLEVAINDVRFGGKMGTQTIAYAPNKVKDLENTGESKLRRPTVYYLFGRLSALPTFPISDEDLLEVLYALQSESLRPARLFDELERNHLLIVGGNFSDWVARMFCAMQSAGGCRTRARCSRSLPMIVAAKILGLSPFSVISAHAQRFFMPAPRLLSRRSTSSGASALVRQTAARRHNGHYRLLKCRRARFSSVMRAKILMPRAR
jgi:hypothetical protein